MGHLIGRIPDTDADQFYLSLQFRIAFNAFVKLVYSGSLPLTMRSVHAENFHNHHLSADLGDFERPLTGQAKVIQDV